VLSNGVFGFRRYRSMLRRATGVVAKFFGRFFVYSTAGCRPYGFRLEWPRKRAVSAASERGSSTAVAWCLGSHLNLLFQPRFLGDAAPIADRVL
jgi:hypothetical protein